MNLIILGNGFDLAHGLPTKTSDYRDYLQNHNKDLYDIMIELYKSSMLWSNFEIALGQPKEKHIKKVRQLFSMSYPSDAIKSEIQNSYEEWIRSIDVNTNKIFNLSKNDLYFSFNYTHTLLLTYGIEVERVKHIHGCVGESLLGEPLMVGHNIKHKNDNTNGDLQNILNATFKDVKGNIEKNKEYFDNLANQDITSIKVFGFSYSDIDFSYFQKIRKTLPMARWNFYYYYNNDIEKQESLNNVNKYINQLGLTQREYALLGNKKLEVK